jgi:hypothetical protein
VSYYCHKCERSGKRLWRNFKTGEFFCFQCALENQKIEGQINGDGKKFFIAGIQTNFIGCLIPAVPATEKLFWSFGSAPSLAFDWWLKLPL